MPSVEAPSGAHRAETLPSLVLVEARRRPGLGDSNAEPFPFIAGYAEALQIPARWICFSHEAWAPSPSPYLLDLTGVAREQLLEQLADSSASHVLFSEVPAPALEQFLAERRPGTRIRHTAAPRSFYANDWLVDWLGIEEEPRGFLPDLAPPSYRCVPVGVRPPPLPTPIIGTANCLYAAPLSRNPVYAGVDLSGIDRRFACAFCPGPSDLKYRYRISPLDLAMRQIAAVRAEPETLWSPREFIVRSAAVFFAMSELVRRVAEEVSEPVALFFACRPDELLARAEDIGAALALARRAGHTIHVFSMGAENFSPAENERFNKGLSTATLSAALARLSAWEREFPETFFFARHGGLGFILFTPWTTLEDLRLNVIAARRLGVVDDDFFLTRRLMLLGDSPLTRLAERDGLVGPIEDADRSLFAWLERHCDPGCRHFFDERDIPWRFREPLTARVCAIAVRMAKRDAVVDDDPWHLRIVDAVQASRVRTLDAFSALLALADEHRDAPFEVLLDAFLELLHRAARHPRRRSA